jgi:DNA mismatch repair protein MLH1
MRELAYFYVPGPLPFETVAKGQHTDTGIRNSEDDRRFQLDSDESKQERWQIQYVLFAAMRKYFVAPKKALDSDVTQVASLPDLYRVFERC